MDSKAEIKQKFGEHLLKLLEEYGKQGGASSSLRQLATRSELEYSNVQRISKGQVDLALSSIVALAKGLDVKPKELLDFF
jgi:DNA-binding Xre family transcriptional regulator